MTPVAVVLAAGSGRRLQPLTERIPKCLIEIGGRPLLGRMLDNFAAAGIQRAIVVTGYRAGQIETYLQDRTWPLAIETVTNQDHATTNNAASLAAARARIDGDDVVLCDGDVVFSSSPVPALLRSAEACVLAVDAGAALGAEEMKVELGPDGRVRRVSKALNPRVCAGESIGVQKIGGAAVPLLWRALDLLLPAHAAVAYYEDAFQRLIDDGVPFGICPVASDCWMEIDDLADLNAARHRFASV
ncbi:MAG: phosphocholine cytidylyltransferase family protein [Acidobacteria bacterium]|nr:phosphocholine cytidylyltransferase family protein [Acidobacteriota bacterium]